MYILLYVPYAHMAIAEKGKYGWLFGREWNANTCTIYPFTGNRIGMR